MERVARGSTRRRRAVEPSQVRRCPSTAAASTGAASAAGSSPQAGRLPGRGAALSRRGFLAVGGSAAALAAVAGPAAASTRLRRPARARGRVAPLQGGTTLVGSPVATAVYSATDRMAAANIFNGYVSLPGALTVQKCFFNEGDLPTYVSADITQLSAAGCKLIMCFRPSRKLITEDQQKLQNTCEL